MLNYVRPKAKNKLISQLTITGVIAFSVVVLISQDSQNFSQYRSIVVYLSVLSFGLLVLASSKSTINTRGLLDSNSSSQSDISNSILVEAIEIEGSVDTIFNSLEKELVGLSVEPLPLGISVWNYVSSNRALDLITYCMRISDPVKKGTYARILYLDICVKALRDRKVSIEQRYRLSSPMMQKIAKRVIPQTDLLVKEILAEGTIDLSKDCRLTSDTENDRDERFEVDYYEMESKPQFAPPSNTDLGSLAEIDFEKFKTAIVDTEQVSSTVVNEHDLVLSDIEGNVSQLEDVYKSRKFSNIALEEAVTIKEVDSSLSGRIDSNNKKQEVSILEGLGQIAYSNFDDYADTILDS